MRMKPNVERILNFFYHRRQELFTKQLWTTVIRVTKARFNIWQRVGKREYTDNLETIQKRPWNIHVELTNLCNSNCIFCAYQYQTRPITSMSDDVFQKVLDDYCSIGGGDFMLTCIVGDPAVDPSFMRRIKQARQRKEIDRIKTITNGIAIKINQAQELIESGISEIQISSGPLEETLYRRIYRNNSYSKVLRNITNLLEYNYKLGSPVEIKLAFRSNLSMKKTLSLPDYQKISQMPHAVEFNTDFDTWTGEITSNQLLDGMHIRPLSKLETEPCVWLYDGPIIFADGKMGLCGCRDFNANSELIVGNINEHHLVDLWQSENVKRLRERFVLGDFPDICQKCTGYVNLDLYRTTIGSNRARLTEERFNGSSWVKSLPI